jgi:glycosyltransferase involved in cell wall biosynthesis
MKVGIVWAGNPQNNRDSIRSLSLNEFVPLFALAEVEFYSIQLGQAAAQLSGSSYPVIDLGKRIKSFMDTTSIIKNMDLVISVDTSVIHLAGALGKPVWNLITYLPDWRWLLNRNDTRWYPSMKLYRQQKKGDWGSVINEVKYDLEKLSRDYRLNIVHKKAVETFEQVKENLPPLYLGLSHGENFGWGVCSKYLHMELTKRIRTIDLEDPENDASNQILPGYLFNVITNSNLIGLYKYSGIKNFGYTFFEYELTKTAAENAKQFDLVFAGSSWCEQKLKDTEAVNSDILIQGIDPELFYPGEQKKNDNLFVIFSGGKFELRKGQDLVLKAIKILQEKYRDIILVNAWYNLWLEVIDSMRYSGYINFINKGNTWNEKMEAIYKLNKIDSSKIITLGLVPNNKMRELYLKTDIGLFPNRCEGGTNLVMMEYMACGKPVVASYNSGHKDILNDYNSIPLKNQKEFKIYDSQNNLAADWCEPQIDEIIEKIEFAYHNREYIKQTGSNAASHLKRFTWSHTASNLIKKIYN